MMVLRGLNKRKVGQNGLGFRKVIHDGSVNSNLFQMWWKLAKTKMKEVELFPKLRAS